MTSIRKKSNKTKVRSRKQTTKRGNGLVDKIIDKLPFEMHLPKYQFCGPGTKLKDRLARGEKGINGLDAACKEHDIAYTNNSDSQNRSEADKILQREAIKRVLSKDASFSERAAALGVAAAMKVKRTLSGKGLGCCRKRTFSGKGLKGHTKMKKKKKTVKVGKLQKTVSFTSVVRGVKNAIKKSKPANIDSMIKVAVASVKKIKKGKRITTPRTIKVPHYSGGMLPLIPIFAGLSALGTIVNSGVGIASAINQAKKAQMELEDTKQHNRLVESVLIGDKSGRGFYLTQSKHGEGFYLSQNSKNH